MRSAAMQKSFSRIIVYHLQSTEGFKSTLVNEIIGEREIFGQDEITSARLEAVACCLSFMCTYVCPGSVLHLSVKDYGAQ